MKKIYLSLIIVSLSVSSFAQHALKNTSWRAAIIRPDGKQIFFNLHTATEKNKTVFYLDNASESIKISDVSFNDDSVIINMPVFESGFRAKIISPDSLNGSWIRASIGKNIVLPFTATTKNAARFPTKYGNASRNLSGKFAITFTKSNEPAIGNFIQKGNKIQGSILTPTGDDRYLEGILSADSVWLSGFDGIHSLLYEAKISGNNISGTSYSGAISKEDFIGEKKDSPTLPNSAAMYVKDSADGHLNFKFKDLNEEEISINDNRFKNKVVILDIMGSWCPNCMDETAFLSNYYKKNKERGVEIIGLCYELTTDFNRSKKSIEKFQKQFDVKYPLLITGVSVADPLRTEKTLPQLTDIKMFPTTIILDKTGKIRKIDTGFEGPATGDYYINYVNEFNTLIDKLLKE
ncbi:MAG: TlpA disulfide reductase family protein [Arachidicoccus sp.]|nr:TlpA disulfide reductase family protein [Arachidicoccus sp.]